MPHRPHPVAWNAIRPQRQLQLQRQKRTHAATLGNNAYTYSYDNIGNHKTAREPAEELSYVTNEFNQHTAIEEENGPLLCASIQLLGQPDTHHCLKGILDHGLS